jgi:ABC-type lipoprotein export system ATPase subunit
MIALKNIEKVYMTGSARTYVLRRISMKVRAGEFVTIMGPSGAGKSTLLGIIGMLDAEWKGEYYLDDIAVHTLRRRERASLTRERCGLVFQHYHLLDNLTVGENLEVPLTYRNLKRSQREAMVAETLDRFNMLARKNLYPSQLSGGQQQLVGIARAVIARPKLILADEPTGNLHSEQGCEVMELFRDLNRAGTTVIQVTHSDANAAYGDRVVRLFDGWMEGDEMPEGGSASARAAAMW